MKQFEIESFIKPIKKLKKEEYLLYPANGYGTVYRVRSEIESVSLRLYTDRAVSKTHRILYRLY